MRPTLLILFALIAGLDLTAQDNTVPNSDPSHPAPRPRVATNVRPANLANKPNLGISGIDAKWANFGRYLQTFVDTVQLQWDYLNDKSSVHPPDGARVSVRFRLDSEGRIAEIIDTDSNGGTQVTRICVSSITDRSPYVKWTDTMIAMLGDSQEMTFTFYYGKPTPANNGNPRPPPLPPPPLPSGAYDLSAVDQIPQPRGIRATLVYPAEMKHQGITGEVTLVFIVDTNGNTRDITVVKSTNKAFNKSAIETVKQWKFRPGKKNGRYVNTRMQIPIVFNLTGDGS